MPRLKQLAWILFLLPTVAYGQFTYGDKPVVALGYDLTIGSGFTLNIARGSVNCASFGIVNYSGGSLTLTADSTSYVYLNGSNSCAVTVNTTGFPTGSSSPPIIPLGIVTTDDDTIIAPLSDLRGIMSMGFQAVAISPAGSTGQTQYKSAAGTFAGNSPIYALPSSDWAASANTAMALFTGSPAEVIVSSALAGTTSTSLSIPSGTHLIFEAGTFISTVPQPITANNVTVEGSGPGITTFQFTGSGDGIDVTPSVSTANITISGFSVTTTNAGGGKAFNVSPSVLATNINLDNVAVIESGSGAWDYGIYGSQWLSSTISRFSSTNAGIGLHLSSNSNANTIVNPAIGGTQITGVELNGAQGTVIQGGTIEGTASTALVDVQTNSSVSAFGTFFENTTAYGVKMETGSLAGMFSGITMAGSGYVDGFYVANPAEFSVANSSYLSINASDAIVRVLGTSGSSGNPVTIADSFLNNSHASGIVLGIDGVLSAHILGGTIQGNSDCIKLGATYNVRTVLIEGVFINPEGVTGYAVNAVALSNPNSLLLNNNYFGVAAGSGRISNISNYRGLGNVALGSELPAVVAGVITDKGGQLFNVKAFGALGNGSTDDTTAIQSTITAALVAGGTVYLPAGNYVLSGAGVGIVYTPAGAPSALRTKFVGAGRNATFITYSGSTDAIHIDTNPFDISRGGAISDLTISCTGNATSGIHIGNIIGFALRDVSIYGCHGTSTSAGFWFDNQNLSGVGFTEETYGENLTSNDNSIGYRFTDTGGTNSFAYSHFYLYCNMISANEVCFQAENDTFMYHSHLEIHANANATTHTVVKLTGTANIGDVNGSPSNHVEIVAEVTGAGSYTGFNVPSGTLFFGSGMVDMPSSTNTVPSPGGILIHPYFFDSTLGSVSNWNGTGNAGTYSNALTGADLFHVHNLGFVTGIDINSSYATFYSHTGGNGFFVYGIDTTNALPSAWLNIAQFLNATAKVNGTFAVCDNGTANCGNYSVMSGQALQNGTIWYCGDCNSTCTAGSSSGRTCFRENGAWTH